MSFKIIRCKEPFIDSFCDSVKEEGYILSSLKEGLDKGLKRKVLVVSSIIVYRPRPNLLLFAFFNLEPSYLNW